MSPSTTRGVRAGDCKELPGTMYCSRFSLVCWHEPQACLACCTAFHTEAAGYAKEDSIPAKFLKKARAAGISERVVGNTPTYGSLVPAKAVNEREAVATPQEKEVSVVQGKQDPPKPSLATQVNAIHYWWEPAPTTPSTTYVGGVAVVKAGKTDVSELSAVLEAARKAEEGESV